MLNMDLSDRRVLVTGAGGFIGSHLTEELARRGAKVRAFVHYKSRNAAGWLDAAPKELLPNIELFAGDVTDPMRVMEAADGIEIIWHLAALIGIPYSYHAPFAYVDVNVKGTLNVLEAARRHKAVRVVHTSTSEVYGTPKTVPIAESAALQGQSPYSASKIGADKLAESYRCSFGLPVVIARPFNTFGPRQSARAVIPTIVSQLIGGAEELRLGALQPTRDLNYVSNTVEGLIAAAFAPEEALGEAINLGSGQEIAIGDLARRLMRIVGREVPVKQDEARMRPANSEVERLLADNARARKWLNWKPTVGLDEGLERTVDWIRSNLREYRRDDYVV